MVRPVARSARILALVLGATILAAPALPAFAADPAASQIDGLDNALISTMKEGKALGYKGRYARLKPAVERALDLDAMTRFAVGPAWTSMSEAQHSELVQAFTRLTIASYAHNFESYSGQKFSVDPNVETRGPDKLVRTKLATGSGSPVAINYRMRESGGAWKVIDVYYNGAISQLTTRRSDFAATLASGGAKALVAHLNALADKLAN